MIPGRRRTSSHLRQQLYFASLSLLQCRCCSIELKVGCPSFLFPLQCWQLLLRHLCRPSLRLNQFPRNAANGTVRQGHPWAAATIHHRARPPMMRKALPGCAAAAAVMILLERRGEANSFRYAVPIEEAQSFEREAQGGIFGHREMCLRNVRGKQMKKMYPASGRAVQ